MALTETIEVFDPVDYIIGRLKVEVSPIIAIASNKHRLYLATETEIFDWSGKKPKLVTDEIYLANMWVFEEAIYVEAYKNSTKIVKRIDSIIKLK